MGNGETAVREIAPSVSGREMSDSDPPIMEQWANEIAQATNYIQTQMLRLRMHSDAIFGSQPVNETTTDEKSVAEVRPHCDRMAEAINSLHAISSELTAQIDRLEAHRLV